MYMDRYCHVGVVRHLFSTPYWLMINQLVLLLWESILKSIRSLSLIRIFLKVYFSFRFDVGEIVAQKSIDVLHRITAIDLKRMLAPIGAELVLFNSLCYLLTVNFVLSKALELYRKFGSLFSQCLSSTRRWRNIW